MRLIGLPRTALLLCCLSSSVRTPEATFTVHFDDRISGTANMAFNGVGCQGTSCVAVGYASTGATSQIASRTVGVSLLCLLCMHRRMAVP
jgi:hypothetical protein